MFSHLLHVVFLHLHLLSFFIFFTPSVLSSSKITFQITKQHHILAFIFLYILYILYILFFHLIIFYFKFLFLSYFIIIDCLSESIGLSIGQRDVVVVVISLHLHNSDFDVTNVCFIILVIYLNALFWQTEKKRLIKNSKKIYKKEQKEVR